MTRRSTGFAAVTIALALTAAACGSDAADSSEAVQESGNDAAPAIAPIADEAEINPGALASGALTVDGQRVEYVTVTPAGFSVGDTAPVLIAFPPGGQGIDVTTRVAASTYEAEALARGWVVFSPALPDGGNRWYDGSEALSPALFDWVETWVTPEGSGFHVAGVSNGGLSSFATAVLQPSRVRSILTFPGFPRGSATREAVPTLAEIPVRMFVGETDGGWVEPAQETFDTLTDLGADVELNIVEGEGHNISTLSNGSIIFDTLDEIRAAT